MSDGPYDFARERQLAAEGRDLVLEDDGTAKPVRRGPLPPEPQVRVGGTLYDEDDLPKPGEF